jgi:CRISPR-associated protein Csm4
LYTEGRQALDELLQMCLKGEPPLVLSNAYPGDLLPRPLVAMEKIAENQILDPIDALKRSKRGKALKDLRYVTVAQFDKLRKGRGFEMEKIEAIDPMAPKIFSITRLIGYSARPARVAYTLKKKLSQMPVHIRIYHCMFGVNRIGVVNCLICLFS